jgi:hypothetical protein
MDWIQPTQERFQCAKRNLYKTYDGHGSQISSNQSEIKNYNWTNNMIAYKTENLGAMFARRHEQQGVNDTGFSVRNLNFLLYV